MQPYISFSTIPQSATGGPVGPPPGEPFKFYISQNGDDNNDGSFAHPWSLGALGITVLNVHNNVVLTASNKWSQYAGHRVGLLPGIINQATVGGVSTSLYSLYQSSPGPVVIAIQGSASAASPTYIGCADVNGLETGTRTTTIDFGNAGVQPTNQKWAMGQAIQGDLTSMVNGNVVINGVGITNFMMGALYFNYTSAGAGSIPTVTNCDLSNGLGYSNNNPGAIWLDGCGPAIIRFNKVRNCQTISTSAFFPWGYFAVVTFNSSGVIVEHNTFYQIGTLGTKTQQQQMASFAYNYVEIGNFAASPSNTGASGLHLSCPPGFVEQVHDNIFVGQTNLVADIGPENEGTINFYNNMIYLPPGAALNSPSMTSFENAAASSGIINSYNNLYWSDAGPHNGFLGDIFMLSAPTGFPLVNNNAIMSTLTFSTATSGAGSGGISFPAWQASTALDANSVALTQTPFTSAPVSPSAASNWASTFLISGPAATAGQGGITTGPVNVLGVGCGF